MDTTVELTSPASAPSGVPGERRAADPADPRAHAALREVVGRMMADELDRFMRNRGM